LAGVVAIFLKIFTLGGLFPGPLIGIAVEAIAVELAMTGTGGRAVGAALGGAVTLATNPLQMLAMIWVGTGREAVAAYARALRESAAAIGLEWLGPEAVIVALVSSKALIGAAGGLWAWWVAGRVMRRLGGQR
jgi:hypothetical protein